MMAPTYSKIINSRGIQTYILPEKLICPFSPLRSLFPTSLHTIIFEKGSV